MSPLPPSMSHDTSLPLATTGQVQRMQPLTNLQVYKRANINGITMDTTLSVFYSTLPIYIFFRARGDVEIVERLTFFIYA